DHLSLHYVCMLIFFPFFFSSRRRHTRSKRDWSSDVCSSDLFFKSVTTSSTNLAMANRNLPFVTRPVSRRLFWTSGEIKSIASIRSEERRVGNECRYVCGVD